MDYSIILKDEQNNQKFTKFRDSNEKTHKMKSYGFAWKVVDLEVLAKWWTMVKKFWNLVKKWESYGEIKVIKMEEDGCFWFLKKMKEDDEMSVRMGNVMERWYKPLHVTP